MITSVIRLPVPASRPLVTLTTNACGSIDAHASLRTRSHVGRRDGDDDDVGTAHRCGEVDGRDELCRQREAGQERGVLVV